MVEIVYAFEPFLNTAMAVWQLDVTLPFRAVAVAAGFTNDRHVAVAELVAEHLLRNIDMYEIE
jgi:hypothetical protein